MEIISSSNMMMNTKPYNAQLSGIAVQVGQEIKKGQEIGKVGSSGASTGPHLHYEVIQNGKKIDPSPFFNP